MLTTIALAMALTCAPSSVLGPYAASGNFSADLLGPVDTRQGTWGRADAVVKPITFSPPAGYRVRILSIRGDLVAWPQVLDAQPPVKAGKYAGVLVGFQTSAPDGSTRCDLCADNTLLYLQGALDAAPTRVPFNHAITGNGLLEPDHKLLVKVSGWLNTTAYPIHLEPTYTITFQFEKETNEHEAFIGCSTLGWFTTLNTGR